MKKILLSLLFAVSTKVFAAPCGPLIAKLFEYDHPSHNILGFALQYSSTVLRGGHGFTSFSENENGSQFIPTNLNNNRISARFRQAFVGRTDGNRDESSVFIDRNGVVTLHTHTWGERSVVLPNLDCRIGTVSTIPGFAGTSLIIEGNIYYGEPWGTEFVTIVIKKSSYFFG